ncbi:MAG: hypothetical protein ACOYOU_14680 [Kiritimatiellia bacterium]
MSRLLKKCRTLGQVTREQRPPAFAGGVCYRAESDARWEDGLVFPIPKGASLSGARYLTFDILLSGDRFVTPYVKLSGGAEATLRHFSPLCECQTRIVIPLSEADLKNRRQVLIGVGRKTEQAARFCISPLTFTGTEPAFLANPALPRGPLVDEMGQSTLHKWSGKKADLPSMVRHLKARLQAAPRQRWPSSFSRWGGWKARRVKATGYFRTHHDGKCWWLVDPDGHLFWSCGLDCVHSSIDCESKLETRWQNLRAAHTALPDVLGPFGRSYRTNPWHTKDDREFNYREANFIQAFGAERWYDHWITIAHAELRRLGFNTAGDWSDEYAARREGTPYTRPLELGFKFPTTPMAGPDFPDVFHPNLAADARLFAESSLRETVNDPCLLGYFLHNEPPWGFHEGGIAVPMLQQTGECKARQVLAGRLRKKYGSDRGLQKAWGMDVTTGQVAGGILTGPFSAASLPDIQEFSTEMLDRLFRALSEACRKVDPHHLNLGVRWWTFPPNWALKAMGHFDVISFNYYLSRPEMVGYGREREPGVEALALGLHRPFMVGEWHFGALDASLSSAGLCRVANQAERGKAFRFYQEHAAALPWCVGTHWFNMYDRNVLYSPASSENYNSGFLDITHSPHNPICEAARKTHARIYALATGTTAPYNAGVKHLFPSR